MTMAKISPQEDLREKERQQLLRDLEQTKAPAF
jgi:hypothetical protein